MNERIYPFQKHMDAIKKVVADMEADERIRNKEYLTSLLKEVVLRLEIDDGKKLQKNDSYGSTGR